MRKTNELIGKPIIHQGTGERLAQVYDVITSADAQRVVALLIDPGGGFHDAQIIPWKHVVDFNDVLLVRGDTPLSIRASESEFAEEWNKHARLSGTPVITDGGEHVGTVGELFIDDNGTVVGYEVRHGFMSSSGRKFLSVEHVQAVGRDAMLVEQSELPTVAQVQKEADGTMNA